MAMEVVVDQMLGQSCTGVELSLTSMLNRSGVRILGGSDGLGSVEGEGPDELAPPSAHRQPGPSNVGTFRCLSSSTTPRAALGCA